MKVLLLESFYGGSHKNVADNLAARSAHDITLHTLSAHHWKWRMRGSALHFAHEADPNEFDVVLVAGLTSVADLRSVWRDSTPPLLLYCHETQLTYPVPPGQVPHAHLAFQDIENLAAADCVAFNSHAHLTAFFDNARFFLERMPKPRLLWLLDEVARKSLVLYPGISVPAGVRGPREAPPLVLWNHRWEFDKNPSAFFAALRAVKDDGVDFSLALLGESFQAHPQDFTRARTEFADNLVAYGFAPDRKEYESWLLRADIVVSTAIQENFGISIFEAIAAGAIPILPNRLSYPELIPPAFHGEYLYGSDDELAQRLKSVIESLSGDESNTVRSRIRDHAKGFDWSLRVSQWDARLDACAERFWSG